MTTRPLYASPVIRNRLLFLLFMAAWLGFSYDRGFNLYDEGNAVYSATLIMAGALPHVDFLTLYTGGVYYFYALLFSIFGVEIGLVRLLLAILIGLLAVITVRLAGRFMPSPWHFIPGVVFLLSFPLNPTAYHSWYAVLGHMLLMVALLRYLETGEGRLLLFGGLAAGVAFLSKQTMGAFSLTSLIAFLIWSRPLIPDDRRRWLDWGIRCFGLCMIAAVYTLYMNQSEYTRLHEKYIYLTVVWCLPFTVLPKQTAVPGGTSSFIKPLLMGMAGFSAPLLIYALYFTVQDGLPALFYGVFQRPGEFLTVWVSQNQFPRFYFANQAPLGALLFLMVWPLWPITRKSRNPLIRYGLWIIAGAFLFIYYCVPMLTAVFSLLSSPAGLLSWANYTLFFSLIYYSPVVIPWAAILLLMAARYFPDTVGLTPLNQSRLAAVHIGHIFLFFCVYPMQNGMYLIFMMPTTLLMLTVVIHTLWRMSTLPGVWTGWKSRIHHGFRLVSLLAMPIVMAGAFLVWGLQYWIGLKDLGDEGRIVWDARVNLPMARGDWGFSLKPEEAVPITAVCDYITARTDADEPVFIAAATGPLLLFLSERHTPARVLFPMVTPNEVDAIPLSLDQSRPSYAVLDWNSIFLESQPLQTYLNENYTVEKEIGEYRIFKRNP